VISPYYDSLIAKVVVWAEDRPSAIARGRRVLSELAIDGVSTTQALQLDILASDPFATGRYSTSFLDDAEELLPALVPA
jgi:acetyl-CoA carboxylase biotin carboxylase subunit